jgi:hypothetical protein
MALQPSVFKPPSQAACLHLTLRAYITSFDTEALGIAGGHDHNLVFLLLKQFNI